MIKTFKCKETEKLFNGSKNKLHADIQTRAFIKLNQIDDALDLKGLTFLKSNKLHALRGDRQNQYAIWINKKWRICFEYFDGDFYDLEITDYH